MKIASKILAVLTALEFLYIMYLETIITVSKRTAEVFGISLEELSNPLVVNLFKNQGIYNGILGVLLLVFVLLYSKVKGAVESILISMCAVAVYGGLTADIGIILKQGLLPFITLIFWIVLNFKRD